MRIRKAFLSCVVVAAVGLLAATGAASDCNTPTPAPSPPPKSCSTGLFQVSVSSGPDFVSCTPTASNPSGRCTEIGYTVSPLSSYGFPDQVTALEGIGIQYVTGPGGQWFPPCVGDLVNVIGLRSCHEQAAKFNPNSNAKTFTIGLAGERKPGPTTVATRKGLLKLGQCTILGIGLDGVASPDQTTQSAETINFKGCLVRFTRDPATNDVVRAQLLTPTGDSGKECQSPTLNGAIIDPRPVGDIEVFLGDSTLGPGKFGDGYISTGDESCTTRVIGGKVYTWGTKPCP
jgi:hypothetical protein